MAIEKNVSELKVGMILSSTVKDNNERVLLNEGSVITDANIFELVRNKIFKVFVTEESVLAIEKAENEKSPEMIRQEIFDQIVNTINWEPENKFEKDLFEMAVQHRLQKKDS